MDDSEFLVANSMNVPCLASSAYYAPTFEYGSRGRSVFGGGGEIPEMSGSPLAGSGSTPVSTPVIVDSSMAAAATTTTITTADTNANTNTNTSTNTNGSVSGGEMYSGAVKPTVPLWNAQADWNYWDDAFCGSGGGGGDMVFDFGMDMDVSIDLGVDVLGTQLGDEFDGLRF